MAVHGQTAGCCNCLPSRRVPRSGYWSPGCWHRGGLRRARQRRITILLQAVSRCRSSALVLACPRRRRQRSVAICCCSSAGQLGSGRLLRQAAAISCAPGHQDSAAGAMEKAISSLNKLRKSSFRDSAQQAAK